jgi:hypothetical protein
LRRTSAAIVIALGLASSALSTTAAAQPRPAQQPVPGQPPPAQPQPVFPPTGPQPPAGQPPGPTVPPGVQPGQPTPAQPPSPGQPPPVDPTQPPGQPGPGPAPPGQPVAPAQPPPGQPPPAQPWYPPPPQYPPPFAWAAPRPEEPKERDGVRDGIPYARHGHFSLDTASFTLGGGELSSVSLVVASSFLLTDQLYFDVRLPLGYTMFNDRAQVALGNTMLGVRAVLPTSSGALWWVLGGGFGLPFLSSESQDIDAYAGPPIPRAFWDHHEYSPDTLPLEFDAAIEAHLGAVTILRFEVEPVTYFPLAGHEQVELVIQHAAEVQFGHAIGGGLRLQGVALPTFDETDIDVISEGDLYQFAMEPFFVIERRSALLRLGLMLPFDEILGPPLASLGGRRSLNGGLGAYGFKLAVGVRLD